MNIARHSLFLTFVLFVLAATGATATTACDLSLCVDPGLQGVECGKSGGTFDLDNCVCVGSRPYEPSATSGCTSDSGCWWGGHCCKGVCARECTADASTVEDASAAADASYDGDASTTTHAQDQ